MSNKLLLTEWSSFSDGLNLVKEALEKTGKVILSGIIQKADTLNQNGRIYPKNILEREVRNYQKFIIENRALGCADHPDTSVIELQKVSHIMREVRMDGNDVYGVVEILNTPNGKLIQSLVESEVKIGISSRGVGSTRKEGDYQVVQDDFQIICWDLVAEPSTPGAFILPENKLMEGINRVYKKSDHLNRIITDILMSHGK